MRGLPKWFKVMVASLRASAQKEEGMGPSHSQTVDSTSKPKVMSFFLLQKLKGIQPTKTLAVWVAHLEEESTDKEEGIESEDPDGIESITGIHSVPYQSSEGCSAGGETLLPL